MDDIKNILTKQEEMLRFDKFNHEEAFKLGCFMAEYAKKKGITIAISIRMNNGNNIFQYCPDGTNMLNEKWMTRKFNTVCLMERSSLMSKIAWMEEGCDTKTHGLAQNEYALCGGGFPVRLKNHDNVIGVIITSNLYHVADHDFTIDCLKEYLHEYDVPMIATDCEI